MSIQDYFKTGRMSALDQNSNIPFLSNEFSKIFENLPTEMNSRVPSDSVEVKSSY